MYYKFFSGFISFLELLEYINFAKFISCCIFVLICFLLRNMIIYLLNKWGNGGKLWKLVKLHCGY